MEEKHSWKDKFILIKNILFDKIKFRLIHVTKIEPNRVGEIITKTDDDIKKELSIDIAKYLLDNNYLTLHKVIHEKCIFYNLDIKVFKIK